MDDKPRLVEPSSTLRREANVMIIFGFPWYTSASQIKEFLIQLCPNIFPVTVRLYTNPTNGSSRGICFVEYSTRHRNTNTSSQFIKNESLGNQQDSEIDEDKNNNMMTKIKCEIEKTPYARRYLTPILYHLTNQNWDRRGRLPELPTDPPPLKLSSGKVIASGVIEGYGDEGFIVRCGALLGIANTVTPSGMANMQNLRKRLREEAAARQEKEEKGLI